MRRHLTWRKSINKSPEGKKNINIIDAYIYKTISRKRIGKAGIGACF